VQPPPRQLLLGRLRLKSSRVARPPLRAEDGREAAAGGRRYKASAESGRSEPPSARQLERLRSLPRSPRAASLGSGPLGDQRALQCGVHGVGDGDVHAAHEQVTGHDWREPASPWQQVLVLQKLHRSGASLRRGQVRQLRGGDGEAVELVHGRGEARRADVSYEVSPQRGHGIALASRLLNSPGARLGKYSETCGGNDVPGEVDAESRAPGLHGIVHILDGARRLRVLGHLCVAGLRPEDDARLR